MNSTSDMDLESCYPEIYKIVYPMITTKCNNTGTNVTRADIENMTDEIYYALEERNDIQVNINLTNDVRSTSQTNDQKTEKLSTSYNKTSSKTLSETRNVETAEERNRRPNNYVLNDLIRILLIRELLGRPGNFPPNRPGFPPPFPPRPGGRPPFRPRDLSFSSQDSIYETPDMYSNFEQGYNSLGF